MELSNAIRQRIINLLKVNHLTVKSLADKTNMNVSTLDNFLLGRNKTITLNILFIICCGFEITLKEFFKDKLFENVYDENERKETAR